MKEQVNHPKHYGGEHNPYEAIKVIEAWNLDFCLGNVAKYISRAGKKSNNELEDLKKALWYLERRIGQIEGKETLSFKSRADFPLKHDGMTVLIDTSKLKP